ncbi:MAG: YncE family protein [Muribaculaceae bacterium]|nr:YncE family protein [Muribaculaceae bacterium]
MTAKHLLMAACCATLLFSCAEDDVTPQYEGVKIENEKPDAGGGQRGFYVLNEGNMGQNKCTLDYYDYLTCTYARNVYAQANPNVVLELGDVGNDIAVHGDKLYIVVNGSHKVEVCNALTAERIGQVNINSPRYIAFDNKGNAYVSSFVGGNGDNGSVVRFNTENLTVTGTVSVGLQPEELVVDGDKLYVANSGQFQAPDYDTTISVVDLNSMSVEYKIEAGVNMHHLRMDPYNNLYVTTRGNYADIPSQIMRFTKQADGKYAADATIDAPCANIAYGDGYFRFYGTTWDANWQATYNFNSIAPLENGYTFYPESFLSAAGQAEIQTPYAIAVNPCTGDIIVTDAKNYVSSGELFYFDKNGNLRWHTTTGDIPGHIAFVAK